MEEKKQITKKSAEGKKPAEVKKAAVEEKPTGGQLAAIRVRGMISVRTKISDPVEMLRLYKNNFCCVVPNTPLYVGMLKQTKDYITWGEIDDETFKLLVEKRGEEFKGRETDSKKLIEYKTFIVINGKKIKPYFRLNAPRKGYGRKGVKTPFTTGGALGYRGAAINELIKRML
ncbi:MAG TPA: 50S ribosomal protein L30 [Candidatus Nanoarchaeia archaeon]|nr:50S ribosomal protein L30 [Candidatus Nanoarchaeia archaeon]